MPRIDPTAFVHPLAVILGSVTLGARVSVWPTAVLRGDSDSITIGNDSNVLDIVLAVRDRFPNRDAFGADRETIARRFYIAAGDDRAVFHLDGRPNPKIRKRRV